jgi:hypothetical protein
MSAHVITLACSIALVASVASGASAEFAGPFCLTLNEPAEAISFFFDGNGTQFIGTGLWLKRPLTAAAALVDGSFHLNFTLSALPPVANPLQCGAIVSATTGQGPARCIRLEGTTVTGILRSVPCVPTASPSDRVSIIGHDEPSAQLAAVILQQQGLLARVNGAPLLGGTALFAVSAVNGPMPQTREAVERLVGDDASRAAIVLLDAESNPDQELRDLAVLEMRQLLERHIGKSIADSLPVLRPELPDFAQSVRGLSLIPIAINPRSE